MSDQAVTAVPTDDVGSGPLLGLDCDTANDERISLAGLLMEANARLTRVLGAELEQRCGLALGWFDVLIRLRRSETGRLTMTELAAQTVLTSGGMTRLVDRIAEAGYVERQDCPSDRRSVYVALTGAGHAKLAEATAFHLDSLDRHLMAPLDAADRGALRTALRKLLGAAPVCGADG